MMRSSEKIQLSSTVIISSTYLEEPGLEDFDDALDGSLELFFLIIVQPRVIIFEQLEGSVSLSFAHRHGDRDLIQLHLDIFNKT